MVDRAEHAIAASEPHAKAATNRGRDEADDEDQILTEGPRSDFMPFLDILDDLIGHICHLNGSYEMVVGVCHVDYPC